jgi:hypothetical protein
MATAHTATSDNRRAETVIRAYRPCV